jgi:hypothetical protein
MVRAMPLSTNPFIVLSYIGGPALLTNSASLLLMGTGNRLARAVDRSRFLADQLATATADEGSFMGRELEIVQRRVEIAARAMASLYLSVAMFAMATLISIGGAAAGEFWPGPLLEVSIVIGTVCGLLGFGALVTATMSLVWEARLAVSSLRLETSHARASLAARLGRRTVQAE